VGTELPLREQKLRYRREPAPAAPTLRVAWAYLVPARIDPKINFYLVCGAYPGDLTAQLGRFPERRRLRMIKPVDRLLRCLQLFLSPVQLGSRQRSFRRW